MSLPVMDGSGPEVSDGVQLIEELSFRVPRFPVPSAWREHAPFAAWIVPAIRPRLLVELGTHNGFSYFQFLDAAATSAVGMHAIAVDTWVGDDHAGFYGEDVFAAVSAVNEAEFGSVSTLFRGTFDEALSAVDDGSVDLLHIDGRHGYEDVKHDFESWLPKLSDRSVVLFHDTAEVERGFGVWRLWEELSARYPSFAFEHGHGLGVLAVGPDQSNAMNGFLALGQDRPQLVRALYAQLGRRVERDIATAELVAAEIAELRAALVQADSVRAEAHGLLQQLEQLRSSTSWRMTAPVRWVGGLRHRRRGA